MRGLDPVSLCLWLPLVAAVACLLPGLGDRGARIVTWVLLGTIAGLLVPILVALPSAALPAATVRTAWIPDWGHRLDFSVDTWKATAFAGLLLAGALASLLDRRSGRIASSLHCLRTGFAAASLCAEDPLVSMAAASLFLATPLVLAGCLPSGQGVAALARCGVRGLIASAALMAAQAGGPTGASSSGAGVCVLLAACCLLPLERRPTHSLLEQLGPAGALWWTGPTAVIAVDQILRALPSAGPSLAQHRALATASLLLAAAWICFQAWRRRDLGNRTRDALRVAYAGGLAATCSAASTPWAALLLVSIFAPIGVSLEAATRSSAAARVLAVALVVAAPPGVSFLLQLEALAAWQGDTPAFASIGALVWILTAAACVSIALRHDLDRPGRDRPPRAAFLATALATLALLATGAAEEWRQTLREDASRRAEPSLLAIERGAPAP